MPHRTIQTLAAAFSIVLSVPQLRGQDPCRADSDSAALADRLLQQAGEQFEGGEGISPIWAKVRRAVEVAPLNHDRLAIILQLAHFLNRPDSAVAWANLARQHWPGCVMSDSALVKAKALPPERHRH
jgi:hypothetical protein